MLVSIRFFTRVGDLIKWPRRKTRPLGSGYRDRVRTQLNESTAKRNFELSQQT